jgi:hypothetical protein
LDEARAWIGDAWSASVADDGDGVAQLQVGEKLSLSFSFIKFVIAFERLFDGVMGKEFLAVARVFAKNVVARFQEIEGAEGDIG